MFITDDSHELHFICLQTIFRLIFPSIFFSFIFVTFSCGILHTQCVTFHTRNTCSPSICLSYHIRNFYFEWIMGVVYVLAFAPILSLIRGFMLHDISLRKHFIYGRSGRQTFPNFSLQHLLCSCYKENEINSLNSIVFSFVHNLLVRKRKIKSIRFVDYLILGEIKDSTVTEFPCTCYTRSVLAICMSIGNWNP